MFDVLEFGHEALATRPRSEGGGAVYVGPERRRHARPDARWFAMLLEETGHGVMLLSDKAYVLYANHLARAAIEGGGHPLMQLDRRLAARSARDQAVWLDALDAARRGLRRLLMLGDESGRVPVAVAPLAAIDGLRLTRVSLARPHVGDAVALQCYARCHGLTAAETRVLECLCRGLEPAAIALRHHIGIATVRTQISSIRHKVGAADITSLVRQVATLPPMESVLQLAGGASP